MADVGYEGHEIPCDECGFGIDPRKDGDSCPVCGYEYIGDIDEDGRSKI